MRIIPLLLALALSNILYAQVTNYSDRMEHIFSAIDKNKVNTGLLKEFGIRFMEIEDYNGTLSTTNHIDIMHWHSLYSSLHTMRVGTVTTMQSPDIVKNNFDSLSSLNGGTILIAAMHYNYNQFKTDAYTNGDVTVVNDRIYDVAGRNPYDTKTAFAISPLVSYIKGSTFSFMLRSDMLFGNSSKTITSIQIDFGNGQGYINVSLDSSVGISYSASGEKIMKVRITYSDSSVVESQSKLYLDYSDTSPAARFGTPNTVFSKEGAIYLGETATGTITVEYGNDGVFNKPLIVVEGFDPENTFDYYDLINDENAGGLDREIDAATGETLGEAIEAEGYDLVFVDFDNSTDYIQRNAYMVEEVINWVNNNKVAGSEKNVVMGMSMGGLVARYALRDMELKGDTHDTKLYISHDAPHQGANVPLAF